jgi:hypothetical protein
LIGVLTTWAALLMAPDPGLARLQEAVEVVETYAREHGGEYPISGTYAFYRAWKARHPFDAEESPYGGKTGTSDGADERKPIWFGAESPEAAENRDVSVTVPHAAGSLFYYSSGDPKYAWARFPQVQDGTWVLAHNYVIALGGPKGQTFWLTAGGK